MKITKLALLVGIGCPVSSVFAGAEMVRVSDFGFDEQDSTRFLQAAIDSGAKKVVIDARRWVTLPLRGRSDQELFFEDGAEVEAKKGAYLGKNDCVFSFVGCSNVVVGGKGIIRMHHADYMKFPYPKAEWRHALNCVGVSNVRIYALRILHTGGDGVYVGGMSRSVAKRLGHNMAVPYSKNVRLEDLYIDTNIRQGLSVTAIDGLVVERCVFKNTLGLPPEAGVDFEPNLPENKMSNIVMRDCVFENNDGFGIELALGKNVPGKSTPFDMTFERCRTIGNKTGVTVHNTRLDHQEIGGKLVFRDCSFEHPRFTALSIKASQKTPFECLFERCRIVERNSEGSESIVEIDEAWLEKNIPFVSGKAEILKRKPKPDFSRANVVDSKPGRMTDLAPIRFRGPSRFVFFADTGREVCIKWKQKPFGKYGKSVSGNVQLRDEQGNLVSEVPLPGAISEKVKLEVPKGGFYILDANHAKLQLMLLEADVPVAADVTCDWRNAIASEGDVYFSVPKNSPRFGFFASGDGGEAIGMEIFAPSGRSVYKCPSVYAWKGHVEAECAEPGLWKVSFRKAEKGTFEDWAFDLTGVEGHVFLSSEKYWSF